MAELFKTAKAINAQQKNVNKLFDAAQALVRTANNSNSATPAVLDKIVQQSTDLQTKIQQQIAVLNTLQSDINTVPASLSQEPRDLVKSLLDDMHGRSREIGKIPTVISTIRAAQKQAASTPAAAPKRAAKKGETVNTGPPVTTRFDPEIAAAAAAASPDPSSPTGLIFDEPELTATEPPAPPPASPVARAAKAARAAKTPKIATPKPAALPAPPPEPMNTPTTGPKFTRITKEEAMASSASAAPKISKPKTQKAPPKPPKSPPTVEDVPGAAGDDEEDDTIAEGFGPYGPGFSRRAEASRLRGLGQTLGPQVAQVVASGGTPPPELLGAVRGYRQSAGLFRTTFGVTSYATRAGSLLKDLEGVQSTLGESAERNRFPELESAYQHIMGSQNVHPDDIESLNEGVRQARRGLAGEDMTPQVRAALNRQLSSYQNAGKLANVVVPGAGGPLSTLSGTPGAAMTGQFINTQLSNRNALIGQGGLTDSRREELRDQINSEQRLLQITEQRLRLIHEEMEAQGAVSQLKQRQYQDAQRELGVLGGRLSNQQKDLDSMKVTGTTRGQIEDMFEGRMPGLGSSIAAWRQTSGRQTGTLGNAALRAMDHPLGFGMGMINAGGIAAGRGIAGAMGATSTEALGLGGAAGSFAAVPMAGALVGVLGMMLGQMGNASQHGMAVENLYRRGGVAGTGLTGVAQGTTGANDPSIFRRGLYDVVLGTGSEFAFNRDQSVGLAQSLATGGMNAQNPLTRERMRGAMGFARYQGVDIGETGEYIASMQRAGQGVGEGGQAQMLNRISQAISGGHMQGRESEVLQSVNRLTQSLASQGVMATGGRMEAMTTILNSQNNPLLRGGFGAQALENLSQGIQGATGYQQSLLFNISRRTNPNMNAVDFRYEQAQGVNSSHMGEWTQGFLNMTHGDEKLAGIYLNAAMPNIPLTQARALMAATKGNNGQALTEEQVQATIKNQQENTANFNPLTQGTDATALGRGESTSQGLTELQNTMENAAANLSAPVTILTRLFTKLAEAGEHLTSLANVGSLLEGIFKSDTPTTPEPGSWAAFQRGISQAAFPPSSTDGSGITRIPGRPGMSGDPGAPIQRIDPATGRIIQEGTPSALRRAGGTGVSSALMTTVSRWQAANPPYATDAAHANQSIGPTDCSGFVSDVLRDIGAPELQGHANMSTLGYLDDQRTQRIQDPADLQPGDVVVADRGGGGGDGHMGIYLGKDEQGRDKFAAMGSNGVQTYGSLQALEATRPDLAAGRPGVQHPWQVRRLRGVSQLNASASPQTRLASITGSSPQQLVSPTRAGQNPVGAAIINSATQMYGASAGRVVDAILQTESGLTGGRGDGGQAYGPFQMEGGKLADFGASVGITDLGQAGVYAEQHPLDAANWAMTHYMRSALSQAGSMSDEDLLTTVLRGGGRGEGQNSGAANGRSRYYSALQAAQADQEVAGSDNQIQSYVGSPMSGLDAMASQQMMALNVRFDNPTVTIQLPDGTVLGQAHLNATEDTINAQDMRPTAGFGGVA